MMTSLVTDFSKGLGFLGSTIRGPHMPRMATCSQTLTWQWYQRLPGRSAFQWYVKSSPGCIAFWVMSGTPSLCQVPVWFTPCQWIVWGKVVLFVTCTVTSSPSRTWISGPGTCPLNANTLALKPGATLMETSSIVNSNSRFSAYAIETKALRAMATAIRPKGTVHARWESNVTSTPPIKMHQKYILKAKAPFSQLSNLGN